MLRGCGCGERKRRGRQHRWPRGFGFVGFGVVRRGRSRRGQQTVECARLLRRCGFGRRRLRARYFDDHAVSDSSSPDSSASDSPDADSAAKAGKAKTKSGMKAPAASAAHGEIEKFEPNTNQTLEEHLRSHDNPTHLVTCCSCKFSRNRWGWSSTFSCFNPVPRKKETW